MKKNEARDIDIPLFKKVPVIIPFRILLVFSLLFGITIYTQADIRDLSLAVTQQNRQITGTVNDSDGIPVIGANVSVKGTTIGSITDVNGQFTLNVPSNATLVISYIGYLTIEIPVGNQIDFTILLKEDTLALDEVVVVGFGSQKKVNLTGSVGVVNSEVFESIPVQNAVQALQGKVPGLFISQSDGRLNQKADMNIRGLATIGQGSSGSALILIDGIEGDLYSINPQDIENISVLKDAAASSIYGSRAPFGVVLVTTKKGSSGRTTVNYNNSFRFNKSINMPQSSDSYSWANFFNDASNAAGWGDVVGPDQMQRIKDYIDGKISYCTIPNGGPNGTTWSNGYEVANDNIDYYDVFYKDLTHSQEHNISASGGNERVNFYLSGNYLNDDGKMNWGGDGFKRYNVFGKIGAQLSSYAEVNYSTRFIRTDYHEPSHMTQSWFGDIGRQSWPIGPLYDPNGILFNDHVLGMRDGGRRKDESTQSIHQLSVILKPLQGWRIVGDASYKYISNFNHVDWKSYTQTAVNGVDKANEWYQNSVEEAANRTNYFNVNLYSDYERTFADKHYIKVMGGFQTENNQYRNVWAQKNGMISMDYPTLNTTSGLDRDGKTTPPSVSGGYSTWVTAGFFGRLNYNYMEKYLFEANLRYDGTSRFRRDSRWGLFPSFSLGWNVAREEFFESLSHSINTLKFRASYGTLGNQNTSSQYPTYQVMGFAANNGSWLINGVKPNNAWPPTLISTGLTWEEVQNWNVGLDFALLNNRLTGSFDYYVRKTLDMVGPADELPIILGTNVPNTNNTDLKTTGFELELTWRDRVLKDLNYSVRFVLSDAYSEITRYSNPSNSLSKYYDGMKWGEIWGYQTVGMARTQEEMDAHLATLPNGGQSNLGSNWKAGDMMYHDLNGDGKIDGGSWTTEDPGDRKVIGNSTPRYNFGLDLSADWKGFDFRLFLQGTAKRDYFQNSFYFWGLNWDRWGTMSLKEHEDYFREDPNHPLGQNLDSYYPRPVFGTEKNRQVQSRYLQNAAYLRLKNLQIGYTIPRIITNKVGIDKLRFFVSGENLATWTKMTSIFDPETISGLSYGNVYPLSKTYSFGVNVTF